MKDNEFECREGTDFGRGRGAKASLKGLQGSCTEGGGEGSSGRRRDSDGEQIG